ncbi:MAG: hypothetical protein ABIJ24_04405 [Nitrospinota bacterium]
MGSNRKIVIIGLGLIMITFASCSKNKVLLAFRGKLSAVEGNKVVTEYCQNCHTHKAFEPNDHVISVSKLYSQEEYARAKECRQCHTLDVDFWNREEQRTHYPADVK